MFKYVYAQYYFIKFKINVFKIGRSKRKKMNKTVKFVLRGELSKCLQDKRR